MPHKAARQQSHPAQDVVRKHRALKKGCICQKLRGAYRARMHLTLAFFDPRLARRPLSVATMDFEGAERLGGYIAKGIVYRQFEESFLYSDKLSYRNKGARAGPVGAPILKDRLLPTGMIGDCCPCLL